MLTNIVLLAVAGVVFALYLARRRARVHEGDE
jgi:hypothetical protein